MLKTKIFGQDNGEKLEVRNLLNVSQFQNYQKLTGKIASTVKDGEKPDTEKLIGVMLEISQFLIAACGVQVITGTGETIKFDGTLLTAQNIMTKIYDMKMVEEAITWIKDENGINPDKKKEEVPGN